MFVYAMFILNKRHKPTTVYVMMKIIASTNGFNDDNTGNGQKDSLKREYVGLLELQHVICLYDHAMREPCKCELTMWGLVPLNILCCEMCFICHGWLALDCLPQNSVCFYSNGC